MIMIIVIILMLILTKLEKVASSWELIAIAAMEATAYVP